jgi:hypothetical protein
MIVAWTGHRPDLFRDPAAAREAVMSGAREVVARGAVGFRVGGQRGVDTWAAQAALALGVPFHLILPFEVPEFARDWPEPDRSVLTRLLPRAESLEIAGGYTRRNRALVTGAHLLVAVWTRTVGGGTDQTIDLARQAGVPVHEILLEPCPSAAGAIGRGI